MNPCYSSFKLLTEKRWQARRDSNPQHPDLESDALPLELLACIIRCHRRHPETPGLCRSDGCRLLRFLMQCMFSAETTIFIKLQFIRSRPLIFRSRVVSSFAFGTSEGYDDSHRLTPSPYSIISLTTPAPTVRPPSRTANRSSFSIAIGVINSADIVTLSPGITISTPSGSSITPVTSVVRK